MLTRAVTLLIALEASRAAAVSGNATASMDAPPLEQLGSLREAFSNSFVMILVTELGDKTFFIAALLAMRHDRLAVFAGAAGALAIMTALSTGLGLVGAALLSRKYTHWAAVILFVYFGIKLLFEAIQMLRSGTGTGPSEELEEVEQSLKDESSKEKHSWAIAMQALTLTFLAEWGDRSQISTLFLAADKDPLGVTLGGIIGHICCTSLAVLGGRVFAARISERAVVSSGGVLFLLFALHGAIAGAD
eukprot:TRINITY_DN40083_c0_g1_i1.p1 TRINITY_DN40083_c0_g1~~TRINITY_DN40083_c0_g1_i1.p1  ORF type:complete len:273 (+),score=41.64 TRINITY_DN40083_c0_g1_i1:79-819(+)